jgi:serine/threonine protein kinase
MEAPSHPAQIEGWRLGEVLGRGAFSVVVQATNQTTKDVHACKVITRAQLVDRGDRDRLQREVNAMAFLNHPHLVTLHAFFSDDRQFYLIMDYCPGGSLYEYIVKNNKLAEPLAAYLFEQVASAVLFCHSHGISHRDLKPENILISKFPHLKVSDMGLCGVISHDEMMSTFCGSPCYCAPECLARRQYDGRLSDVWSLGVVLFAMVTGSVPWTVANTSAMLRQVLSANYTIPAHVSPKCRDLIQKMIVCDPAQRVSVERVLAHPWMACAQKCRYAFAGGALPPRAAVESWSFADRAAEAAKNSSRVEGGIISPFQDSGGSEPELEPEAGLVRLSKFASVGCLLDPGRGRRTAFPGQQVKASYRNPLPQVSEL